MAIDWSRYWWQPGFVAGFFAVGVPYWLVPYNQDGLPISVLGAVVVIAATALARVYSGKHFWRVVAVMAAVVPAVVMVRVVFDVLRDPTSHNLWPFEVVIAALVGGFVAFAGALLGGVVLARPTPGAALIAARTFARRCWLWLNEGKHPMSD